MSMPFYKRFAAVRAQLGLRAAIRITITLTLMELAMWIDKKACILSCIDTVSRLEADGQIMRACDDPECEACDDRRDTVH